MFAQTRTPASSAASQPAVKRRTAPLPMRVYFGGLLAIVVLAAVGAVLYLHLQADHDARTAARVDMDFTATSAARELGDSIALVRTTVAQLAGNPGVAQVLDHPSACGLTFASGSGLGHVDVVRADGTVTCSSRTSAQGVDVAPTGWFARARRHALFSAPVLDRATGHHAAVVAAPAVRGSVVAAFIDLDATGSDLVSLHGAGRSVEFLVTDARSNVVAARSIEPKRWIGKQVPALGPGRSKDLDGTTRIYGESPVRGTSLVVFAGEAESAVLASRHRLQQRELAIVLGGLLLVLAAAFVVYRSLVRPIRELSGAVRGAPGGAPVVVKSGPAEVRRLGEDVNLLLGSVSHELTERRHAEENYRLLFDRHPAPMWVYDSETLRFLAVNDAAVRAYGYSRAEFLAMTIEQIRPPEEREALRELIADEAQRATGGGRTWRHLSKDGTPIDVTVRSTDLSFDGRAARLVHAQDITEQRRLEEQLLQSQKMEAVGSLAGGIAHDFNNLLTVVQTSASMLLRHVDDPTAREDLERISAAGARGAELTRQLLAFSRRQVLRPQVTDVNAVVEDALGLLHRLLGENIEVSWDPSPQLPSIVIDRGQLSQAIVNLAVNARDAMPDGGRLTITTAEAVLDEAYAADHVGVEPGSYVVVQVTDSGVGMSDDVQKRVFDPFFTTKDEGTGLGLATVYGIVKQSNGHVWLYSELGLGTTFKLYFPAARSAEVAELAPKRPAGVSLEGTERVLLVEDDPAVRPLVALTLRSYGYTVIEAATPDEALALDADVDLVVTDVVMPGMNGRELAERLVAARPELKVLFTSGYPADAMVRTGIAEASAAYIEKPFLPDDLASAVRSVLDA